MEEGSADDGCRQKKEETIRNKNAAARLIQHAGQTDSPVSHGLDET